MSHEDDDEELCSYCNGSGEGMYDGSLCGHCRGSGVVYDIVEVLADDADWYYDQLKDRELGLS